MPRQVAGRRRRKSWPSRHSKVGRGSPRQFAVRLPMVNQSYFKSRRPFILDELRNPRLSIDRHGVVEALRLYQDFVEPLHVHDRLSGLPRDWAWRKLFVYVRDKAQCQHCRHRRPKVFGRSSCNAQGDGGNHALDNLELLCRFPCHQQEHPRRPGNDAWEHSVVPARMEAF